MFPFAAVHTACHLTPKPTTMLTGLSSNDLNSMRTSYYIMSQDWEAVYNRARNEGKCGRCRKIPTTKSICEECREKQEMKRKAPGYVPATRQRAMTRRTWRKKLRDEVILGYGGKCACCGESKRAFLTLDHVNNDGSIERGKKKNRGIEVYRRAKQQGYPPDLQILCFNCNCGRALNNNICPHKE